MIRMLEGHTASMQHENSPFEFSPPWFSLGIVTPTRLAEFRGEWERGEDRSPEHYRWRAFRAFVNEARPFSQAMAEALYALGASDPDRAMGEAMMHKVVELPECPEVLVEAAATSGVRHLARAAERHRAAVVYP